MIKNFSDYVMCIYLPKDFSQKFGIAICDLITGDFTTSELRNIEDIKTLISTHMPNIIYMNESFIQDKVISFIDSLNIKYEYISDMRFNPMFASEILRRQFEHTPKEMGLEENEYAVGTSGALLFQIEKTSLINKLKILDKKSFMMIDLICAKYLEFEKLYKKLNNTKSSLGERLLRKHLFFPTTDELKIENQLEVIDEFNNKKSERDELRKLLSKISDIFLDIKNKNLKSINSTLEVIPKIKKILNSFESKVIKELRRMDSISEIKDLEISTKTLKDIANKLAVLDVITTHSYNSEKFNLIRPHINSRTTDIIDNFSFIDFKDTHNMIIATDKDEKLEYRKKEALIFVLVQIGSFVPAKFASVKIHYRLNSVINIDKKEINNKKEPSLNKFLQD